ncbi:polymorphic toxin type 46 domain-containing protein [Pseudomonas sp. CAN2814]|uniref:polymorphic toxin type 46 domain-containing protein n=1 Tax=Pseudomonas sp. CAN1 TaxID=3046726 RepID=UPI002648C04E|nr:polymorphic toxin type 46 domain-containing protein [Pseudomonas sp. CAN1]MDN6858946.1 polymorphic toxin type 46 domain-containing protein [Pseudomonas sp. CAN1]
MDAQAAARLGDEIAHGFGVAAMVAGAVAGALIGAAVIAATAATGGVALVIMAGAIAAGGLSMFQIVKGLTTIFELPEPTTGVLIRGSLNVYVNDRNAMRAGDDVSEDCSGLPLNHPWWPFPVLIAEGSATVYINGKPAARLHSKMVCGAHIKTGSKDTFIGGPTERVAFVLDLEEWLHTGLEALGIAAALGGLVLAALAGGAALGTFLAVGGMIMGGMELLGQLGDRLGPGYRDLLQGVAGMALLGIGPKMARMSAAEKAAAEAAEAAAARRAAQAERRAYLNDKFGRSGDLNRDINYRGNQETAMNFFKSKGISQSDAESYMNGLDFNHPVTVETVSSSKNLWQYQSPGAPQGNWYTLTPRVQPTELGINPMGTNRAANTIEPKVLNAYKTTQKVEVLRSTAAPTTDFWSVKGQNFPAKGGATQLFSNEKGSFGLTPP